MVHIGELCVEYLLNPVFTLIQAGVSCEWAHDSQCFLLEFFDTIYNSPSQIYHSALLLSPSSSWVHKCYSAELSQVIKVVKGLPAGWATCSRTVTLGSEPQALGCWKDTIAVGLASGDIITLDVVTGSQLAVLSGHIDWVRSITFSSDGTSLVSGSDDKTLKLWDVQTGGVIKTFHGHTDWIRSVSISFNYTLIASGSDDRTIRLWDIQTGECCCVIKHGSRVVCVSFYPTNPQHLISISGGIIQQWGIDGHQIEPTYKGTHAAFSLDGTHLALCGKKVTTIQNFNSGVIVAKCPTNNKPRHCCFSPNGRLVAVAAGSTAYVWDVTGSDPYLIETFIGHTKDIASLTFSSSSLISASEDQSVKFWQIGSSSMDLATSNPKSTPLISAPIRSVGLEAENGIAISSDLDGVVKTWDLSTGLCNVSFQIPAKGEDLRDVKMIDGRLIVVWHDGDHNICIWDPKKEGLLHRVTSRWAGARGLRISGDGSKVFCMTHKFVQGWSMLTGEAMGEVEVRLDSYLNPLLAKGSRIWVDLQNSPTQGWDFGISGSSPISLSNTSPERPQLHFIPNIDGWNKGPSRIEDTVTGKVVFQLPGRYARPKEVRWDGQHLVAGYESGEVLILDFSQMLSQ
jgi:WD40 repeat protein